MLYDIVHYSSKFLLSLICKDVTIPAYPLRRVYRQGGTGQKYRVAYVSLGQWLLIEPNSGLGLGDTGNWRGGYRENLWFYDSRFYSIRRRIGAGDPPKLKKWQCIPPPDIPCDIPALECNSLERPLPPLPLDSDGIGRQTTAKVLSLAANGSQADTSPEAQPSRNQQARLVSGNRTIMSTRGQRCIDINGSVTTDQTIPSSGSDNAGGKQ
ncbi:hypothetical protein BU17DRAFT_65170 [Hysterangium stoloniferum]|nr:hypothetical protein BU17DRAFT_65170 [Hysterangium stoloniferum]